MERFWELNLIREKKLFPLFLNESFRGVAVSLLSLFSSIFVYKTVFSLTGDQKLSYLGAIFYFLLTEFFKLLASFLAKSFSLWAGLKKQIYIGEGCLIICLFLLLWSLSRPFLLLLAPVFFGLSAGFYWFGRHCLMAKIGSFHDFGKELGINSLINTVLSLATPFFGGLLIAWAGYSALFLGSVIFVLLSFVFLRRMEEERIVHDSSFLQIISLFRQRPRMFLAYLGNSAAATIYVVIFPLYLYLILKKELSLGEFFSLAMILTAIVNIIIGRWVDVKGKRQLLGAGACSSFLIWFGRALTKSVPTLMIFDVLDRFTAGMTGIPLSVLSYQKAVDGHSTGRAILFRETAIGFGAILASLVLVVVVVLGLGLESAFILAALFSLAPILITRHEKIE